MVDIEVPEVIIARVRLEVLFIAEMGDTRDVIHALCDVDRLNAAHFSNGFFNFIDFFVVNDFLSGSSKLARWGEPISSG